MDAGRRIYLIRGKGTAAEDRDLTVAVPPSSHLEVDAGRCSGCRDCEMVCSLEHEAQVVPSLARLTVRHDAFTDDHPDVLVCPQCSGPECLLACPRGAILIDEQTGARVVDASACDGCGLCVEACHLGMIWLDPQARTAYKCDLCSGEPQCVLHCPQKALTYRRRGRQ